MKFSFVTLNENRPHRIKNNRVEELIKTCIEKCLQFFDNNILSIRDVEFLSLPNTHWAGEYNLPKDGKGCGKIILNECIFEEKDEYIISIILHEVAHFYQQREYRLENKLYYSNGKWKSNIPCTHDEIWRKYADEMESFFDNIKINQMDNMTSNIFNKISQTYKYKIVCKNCGKTIIKQKKDGFINEFLLNYPQRKFACECGGRFFDIDIR